MESWCIKKAGWMAKREGSLDYTCTTLFFIWVCLELYMGKPVVFSSFFFFSSWHHYESKKINDTKMQKKGPLCHMQTFLKARSHLFYGIFFSQMSCNIRNLLTNAHHVDSDQFLPLTFWSEYSLSVWGNFAFLTIQNVPSDTFLLLQILSF